MGFLKHIYAIVENLFGLFLGIFSVVVMLLLVGLLYVIFAEITILYHLLTGLPALLVDTPPNVSSVVFLLLELVDLTLVSILIIIIATTAFNMIFEMTGRKSKNLKNGEQTLIMSGQASMNLEAKLIFSLIGLSAVAILGVIFELSSRIENAEFELDTIPPEYYIFGAGYILLILTSIAVHFLTKADKE